MTIPQDEDSALAELKEHTKNVMIPLLIKIFHLRFEGLQTQDSLEDRTAELQKLSDNLKLQKSWIETCQIQIDKALLELSQGSAPNTLTSLMESIKKAETEHPAVKRSFQKALSKPKKVSSFDWLKRLLGK